MRSVLVIYEFPGATPHIRAGQFSDLFRESRELEASFAARKPGWFGRADARLQSRWWSAPLSRALRRFEHRIDEREENRILARSRTCDVVYLIRLPSWRLHKALWDEGRVKVVMDLNDGLWLPYHRRGGYEQLEAMLRHSHAVACENEFLCAYARQYNANVHLVPDCPQIEDFDAKRAFFKPPADRITLGWIGGSVAADNLGVIFEPLEDLFSRHANLHLRILGADQTRLPRFEAVKFSCKPTYTNEEMIQEALQMDIGLFPLYRTQDSKTRGTLKSKIYMSAGVVAACQNWGENADLIQHRRNGILAGSPEEWSAELEWLILNPARRAAIAEEGLATVRSSFTRRAGFERLASVFESV